MKFKIVQTIFFFVRLPQSTAGQNQQLLALGFKSRSSFSCSDYCIARRRVRSRDGLYDAWFSSTHPKNAKNPEFQPAGVEHLRSEASYRLLERRNVERRWQELDDVNRTAQWYKLEITGMDETRLTGQGERLLDNHRHLVKAVYKSYRRDRQRWLEAKAAKLEKAANRGEWRMVYRQVATLSGKAGKKVATGDVAQSSNC